MSIAQKMTELIAEITEKLTDNDSVTFETCDAAHFGWDAEKHHAMHALARHGVSGKTEEFVSDCVAALRLETAKLCDEMLASFKGSRCGVHQKTLNRLNQFIDHFKSLNFAGDAELEAHLEETRRRFLTQPAEAYRDNVGARAKLDQGIKALGDTARELARKDAATIVENFGAMGRRRFSLAA